MWQAELLGARTQRGRLFVRVRFWEGPEEVEEVFEIKPATLDHFLRTVEARRSQLESADDLALTLVPGPIPRPTPPAPSPEEVAKGQWLERVAQLRLLKQVIADGALPQNEPEASVLEDAVRTDFKPEYL